MKPYFSYSSNHQIWRIQITDSDKLILETRDMDSKEVYFHCVDLTDSSIIFENFQLEEKHWIGIESIYKDIIFFHRFPKPDMPGHKEVTAFDISSQKILWNNEDLSFLFAFGDKVYCFKQGFEERYFYSLDILTGELKEELGDNYQLLNNIRNDAESKKDWSVYGYPKSMSEAEGLIVEVINKYSSGYEIAGEIEFNTYKNYLMFNFHSKTKEGSFDNHFYLIDLDSRKVLNDEILNKNAPSLFKDAFFVYKNFLFLLKEKNEVLIFNLE